MENKRAESGTRPLNSYRETKFSGANGDKEISFSLFIRPQAGLAILMPSLVKITTNNILCLAVKRDLRKGRSRSISDLAHHHPHESTLTCCKGRGHVRYSNNSYNSCKCGVRVQLWFFERPCLMTPEDCKPFGVVQIVNAIISSRNMYVLFSFHSWLPVCTSKHHLSPVYNVE